MDKFQLNQLDDKTIDYTSSENDNLDNYSLLKKYLINNKKKLSKSELNFLLWYLYNLKNNSIEFKTSINEDDLLNDIEFLISYINQGELTLINKKRIDRLTKLSELLHYFKVSEIEEKYINNIYLNDISYDLDYMYAQFNLPLRKNSTVLTNIKKRKKEL